jgi:hypothetical protein
MVAQSGHCPTDYWMPHLRRDFGSRFNDEAAERHARVRDRKFEHFDPPVAIEKQIQVERSGRPALRASASGELLNAAEPLVETFWRKRRLQQRGPVEKSLLPRRAANWLAFVPTAYGDDRVARHSAEQFHRQIEIRSSIPQI